MLKEHIELTATMGSEVKGEGWGPSPVPRFTRPSVIFFCKWTLPVLAQPAHMAHIYSHPPKVVNDELHLIARGMDEQCTHKTRVIS